MIIAAVAATALAVGVAVTAAPALAAPHPAITAMSTHRGPSSGGNSIVITGTGFTEVSFVRFDAIHDSSFTVQSSTQLTVVAPKHAPGFGAVSIETRHGTSGPGGQAVYKWRSVHPSLTGVAPTSGPIGGGNQVQLTGRNLTEVSAVLFGTTPATSVTAGSPTSLTAIAPKHPAGSAPIRVVTKHGTSAVVANGYYTWIAPTVTNVAPNAGPVAGGTPIVISGTGLTDVKYVLVGSTRVTKVTDISDQFGLGGSVGIALLVTAPRHVLGRTDIRVITRHGATAVVGNDGRYSYVPAPRALKVGAARTIDANPLVGISCPSATFCAAYDSASDIVMYRDGVWGMPAPVAGEVGGIGALSCTSATFCMAGDASGNSLKWNGATWQTIAIGDGQQWAISCASPTFCGAVDPSGDGSIYNGTRWVYFGEIENDGFIHLTGVSCPTVGFCYATGVDSETYPVPPNDPDSDATVTAYRNGSWSFPNDFFSHEPYDSISCAQAHFCAVGTAQGMRVWTGSTPPGGDHWSADLPTRGVSTGVPAGTVECSNATFCLEYWQDPSTGLKHWVRADGASVAAQHFRVVHPGSFPTAVSCWARYACQFVGGTDTYRSS
jgi:hypothetical protein